MADSGFGFDNDRHRNRRRSATRIPAQTADQFVVIASYVERSKQYYGKLRVTRSTDGRVIYPYEGAEEIGPFLTRPDAVAAAQLVGEKFVQSDLLNPE